MLKALVISLAMVGIAPAVQEPGNVIEGKVVRGNAAGVPDVQITLVGPIQANAEGGIASNPLMAAEVAEATSTPIAGAITDGDGHFVFKNLAVGKYSMIARREGFIGAAVSGEPPTSILVTIRIAVAAGQPIVNVSIPMYQGAAIGGRIRDSAGNAVPRSTVSLYQRLYDPQGRAVLHEINSKTSDDRGEYRLFWIGPGEYYVGAQPGGSSGPFPLPGSRELEKTFFGNSRNPWAVQPVVVKEGDELKSVDINLLPPSPGFTVSGQVTAAGFGAPMTSIRLGPIRLVPRDLQAASRERYDTFTNVASDPSNGQFEIRDIRPGSYVLIASILDPATGQAMPGQSTVDVRGGDVPNVQVTVRPGVALKGHVTYIGDGASPTTVQVQRMDISPVSFLTFNTSLTASVGFFQAAAASVGGTGEFAFPALREGHEYFQIAGLPPAAYIADIRQGKSSIFDSGLQVNGEAPEPIEILVNMSGSTVQGVVRNAAQKVLVNAMVVLVPEASRRGNMVLYKISSTDTSGRFALRGVAPGGYKMFAWEAASARNAWMNSEFMKSVEEAGQSVLVSSGSDLTLQLQAIP